MRAATEVPRNSGHPRFVLSKEVLDDAAKLAGDKLREINTEALAKQNYLTATLTRFRMDLDKGEEEQILLRSRR